MIGRQASNRLTISKIIKGANSNDFTSNMPSVESLLTRSLDLRFIDARNIAAEARLSLGIDGYPSEDQVYQLRDEAVRIFQSKSQEEQRKMRRQNWDLEAVKIPAGSMSMSDYMDSGGSDSGSVTSGSSETSSRRGLRGMFRR